MSTALRFFTPETAATFRAAAARIVPDDGGAPGAGSDAVLALVDGVMRRRSETDQKLFGSFLRALELLPVFRYGRGFSRLSPERQDAVLRFFETTRLLGKLRQGFFGLKTFTLMGFYGQEGSWDELAYPGPRLDAPFYQLGRRE